MPGSNTAKARGSIHFGLSGTLGIRVSRSNAFL